MSIDKKRSELYELIVLDVDGTLLTPSGMLTNRVEKAIEATMLRGCKITLATGRFLSGVRDLVLRLHLEIPLILHSGSLVQTPLTKEILYENLLMSNDLIKSIDIITSGGWQPVVYDIYGNCLTGPLHLDPSPETTNFLEKRVHATRLTISELHKVKKAVGVGVFTPQNELNILQGRLLKETANKVLIYRPGPGHPLAWYQLEVFPSNCSKGQALNFLANLLNISIKNIMVIGDNENDLEMIREAGMGIAMGNAPEYVKLTADAVVGTNEKDGVADALEKYILNI